MKFISTRGNETLNSASEAIVKGLASDGGLFVPEFFPNIYNDLEKMLDMDYPERAAFVLSKYLEEYDYKDLEDACKKAYYQFEDEDAAPLVKLEDKLYILELFRGPTLAFKDIALTLLPYLLRKGADHIGIKEQILILVATSGDTGKAALEGFKNQAGIKINVFYPDEGVSDMQKLQMTTTTGNNVNVVAVKGNFDDCQSAVKNIFNNKEYIETLKDKGVILSSANSINFGRLAPQIAYYFSSYLDLVASEEIKMGDKIDFVVPTGNFGNILAGYYAKKMGLPVNKLVCASNENNVLTDFFDDGEYDIQREFYKTTSPSMDILISSNLERLIFELSGRNAELTNERMLEMKKNGKYKISTKELNYLKNEFYANFSSQEESDISINNFFEEYAYVLDPHTAVAVGVADSYATECNNKLPIVILSTASPYKFPSSVYKAITGKKVEDAFKASKKLFNISAMPIPAQIKELLKQKVRFSKVSDKNKLFDDVIEFIEK